MTQTNLILNGTNIKALFMDEDVAEITITRDIEAFNLTEQESNEETIEDFSWITLVDFGIKNIIAEEFYEVVKINADQVCAVKVQWKEKEEETFINKNFTKTIQF